MSHSFWGWSCPHGLGQPHSSLAKAGTRWGWARLQGWGHPWQLQFSVSSTAWPGLWVQATDPRGPAVPPNQPGYPSAQAAAGHVLWAGLGCTAKRAQHSHPLPWPGSTAS